jgi:hypothetical protein
MMTIPRQCWNFLKLHKFECPDVKGTDSELIFCFSGTVSCAACCSALRVITRLTEHSSGLPLPDGNAISIGALSWLLGHGASALCWVNFAAVITLAHCAAGSSTGCLTLKWR